MSGTASSGQFNITNGQIIDPNGNNFIAEGLNVYDSQMGDAAQILADFPGVNFIRLNVYSYQNPSAYASFIQTMTSKGVVVELEDHTNSNGSDAGGGSGTVFTGSQLTNELNWYSAVAGAYANNPYVWFGTDNEPPNNPSAGALSTWQQQTYNAIRNAGNNSPIMMELVGGGNPGTIGAGAGMTVSDYASMNNIIWDLHYYGWVSSYSTNQSTVDASLASAVSAAQTITSANGKVPVIIGEYGPSTDGTNTDPNGNQVLQAVQSSTSAGQTAGAAAWGWNSGVNDNLTDGSGNLTTYGQEVAQWIAAHPGSTPVPVPTPAPKPTVTPSTNDAVVLAGSTGAITDASGNAWTITAGGQVATNGIADTTTAGVVELAYVNGTIWQENSANLWWGETQPNASWSPQAGTAVSPLPASPSPAPVVTPSANDTVLAAGSGAVIVDAAGNKWTITSGAQVAVNGQVDTTTAGVIALAYVNGTIWQENSANLWWGETQPNASWAPTAGTAVSPLPAPPAPPSNSPNDTVVMAGSTAVIVDTSANHWTISSGGQIAVNGTIDPSTANVKELAYVNGEVWQENASNLWWGKTSPAAAWSPNAGTSTSPLPTTLTIAATQSSATIALNQATIAATSGNHMVFISGTGDTVGLSGGTDTVTDTGSGNTYVIPAAGNGYDAFTTNVLTQNDTLDLRTALAATKWTGSASTLSQFLSVKDSSKGAVLSISSQSGGSGVGIASIGGATTATLSSILAHAIT